MFCLNDCGLNEEQRDAITEEGNVFLVACPGSGKTRTLTYKIAYELSRLQNKKQFIAAITYTNRAADEIHDRIEQLGVDTSQLWIGTIHAFCLEWILKPYSAYHDELKNGFKVVNSYDSEKILTEICKPYQKPRVTYWDCGYYFRNDGVHFSCKDFKKIPYLKQIFSDYFKVLSARNQIDFEQILYYSYQILVNYKPVSTILSKIFKYILVDEYQDTKDIQYHIIASILRANSQNIKLFMVGDPNQSIYQSLGGFPIEPNDLKKISSIDLVELSLSKNYRSSERIVNYFKKYNLYNAKIEPQSEHFDFPSLITYNDTISCDDLEDEIVELLKYNIDDMGISPEEICITGPQWVHLASMTRRLMARLPGYDFDGPGMTPFSRDIDNFWYKLCRIALTEPSPTMYLRRMRWAKEVITELISIGASTSLSAKYFLKCCNGISIDETDGLEHLKQYFQCLFETMGIEINAYQYLSEHYASFFQSSQDRINRLSKDGATFISDISSFRKVFKPRNGITVSTNHGIKGAEFDTVIAFALLEGMVPHFSDDQGETNAEKMLYVIASRAKKNLHLFSERGRLNGLKEEYTPTEKLAAHLFNYDQL